MNQQFATLCDNAKAAGLIVITVSLDLRPPMPARKSADRRDEGVRVRLALHARTTNGASKKLYFNATGGTLQEFKKIADELSNLRIVG